MDWERGSIEAILAGEEPTPLRREHSPPDDVEAMLDELGIDRRKWRRVDQLTRENLITAYRIARERRERASAEAAVQNHPSEGTRKRGA